MFTPSSILFVQMSEAKKQVGHRMENYITAEKETKQRISSHQQIFIVKHIPLPTIQSHATQFRLSKQLADNIKLLK